MLIQLFLILMLYDNKSNFKNNIFGNRYFRLGINYKREK